MLWRPNLTSPSTAEGGKWDRTVLDIPLRGYKREDGRTGIRNLVVVMAAADNVNPLVRKLAQAVPGTVCLPASYGRGQLGEDLEITVRTMAGLAAHPNVANCLIVSFEAASAERIAKPARGMGRQVAELSLLEEDGLSAVLQKGTERLRAMTEEARSIDAQDIDVSQFLLGLECGGSDTTSGLFGNPSLGVFTDALIVAGGSAIFSEPVECLGGEELIGARARTPQAKRDMTAAIHRFRDIALSAGVDLTGINPTADNIAGGLTTIEEKSLGAIAKSGSGPIEGLIGYGECPPANGLWLMDAPAAAVENLTAIAASGAQAILFVTGSGNPVGHPIAPTIKICANPQTVARMPEHIDIDLSHIFAETFDTQKGASCIAEVFAATVNGQESAAERLDYLESNISRFGLSV
jgi:altronate dehydratase large subunit